MMYLASGVNTHCDIKGMLVFLLTSPLSNDSIRFGFDTVFGHGLGNVAEGQKDVPFIL